jgi:hypothetical protein
MSGGALAANHYLIHSTKQISPKVLKKLKGNRGKSGVTGKAGLPGAPGKDGAAGKEGPQGAEGNPHTIRWRATVGKAIGEATTVELAKVGPFTVTGHCYEAAANTDAATYISTSETGSFAQGYSGRGSEQPLTAGQDLQISEETASGETASHETNFVSANDGSWSAVTATGSASLDGFGDQGVWLQGESGPACSFSGFLVVE